MTIATLPGNVFYDTKLLSRKVQMKKTVTHISFHLESQTYALVTHEKTPAVYPARKTNDEPEPDELQPVQWRT